MKITFLFIKVKFYSNILENLFIEKSIVGGKQVFNKEIQFYRENYKVILSVFVITEILRVIFLRRL